MKPLSWDVYDLPFLTVVEGDVSVVRKLSLSTSASSTEKQDRNAKQEEKDYSYVSTSIILQGWSWNKEMERRTKMRTEVKPKSYSASKSLSAMLYKDGRQLDYSPKGSSLTLKSTASILFSAVFYWTLHSLF